MAMNTILLVEDDNLFRKSLKRILEDINITIREASSGTEGLKIGTSRKIDVILTDYRLPDFDGITMVNRLKQKIGEITVILISAYEDIDMLKKAASSGIYDYLPKPFEMKSLESSVQRAMKRNSFMQNNRQILKELNYLQPVLQERIEEKIDLAENRIAFLEQKNDVKQNRENKYIQKNLHALFNSLSIGITVANDACDILFANKEITKRFKRTIYGQKCYKIFKNEHLWQKALDSPASLKITTKNGRKITLGNTTYIIIVISFLLNNHTKALAGLFFNTSHF